MDKHAEALRVSAACGDWSSTALPKPITARIKSRAVRIEWWRPPTCGKAIILPGYLDGSPAISVSILKRPNRFNSANKNLEQAGEVLGQSRALHRGREM